MRTLILALLVACGAPGPAPVAPEAAPVASRDVPPPSAQEEVCLTLQRAFQARLDQATGACVTDMDCGCYRGVAPGLGCGGVSDFATATALSSLTTQFEGAGCAFPSACEPTLCVTACTDGRCEAKAPSIAPL